LSEADNGQRKPEKMDFVACHYPLASWDGSDKGSLQLHGHLHSQNNQVSHHFCAPFQGAGSRFDIGIDNAGWFGYDKSPIPIRAVWNKYQAKQKAWAELIDDPRYK
jgi:calcineurin-like phosphoesterase family protein